MDIADFLAPTSDQLDAVDLLGGPRTFTVTSASAGNAEQPVQVHLAEFPRPWRPGKSMRRVLAAAWGTDASKWTGRRVTLFCDPEVRFGSDKVGGTRISHMSDLPGNKRLSVPLLVSRGKAATYVVEPLTEAPKPAAAPVADKPLPEQMRVMGDLFTSVGITSGRDKATFVNDTIGRQTSGWDDLTADDVDKVIVALREGGAS